MNKKCISLSLYGNNIVIYYLPLLFNLDVIKQSKLDYDIVIKTTEQCKELLLNILKQENLQYDNLKIKTTDIIPKFSKGMFWRYHELLNSDYDHIVFSDIDSRYMYNFWWIYEEFFKTDKQFGTYMRLDCNGHLLDGGNLFCNLKYIDRQFKDIFKKICDFIDDQDTVNYDMDQIVLEFLLKDYMKTDKMIIYTDYLSNRYKQYNNEQIIQKRISNINNNYISHINLDNIDIPNIVYKRGWYFNEYYKSLKYYDFENKIYTLNGIQYKVEDKYKNASDNSKNRNDVNKQTLQKIINLHI